MSYTFFSPGPAQLYPTVEAHIQQALKEQVPSFSHRSKAYEAHHQRAVEGIKTLLEVPEEYEVFFHSSATEIWERLLQNCVSRKSCHFVNGSFSGRFFDIAAQLGLEPVKIEAAWGEGFDFSQIEIPEDSEMVNCTHNETSTGVMIWQQEVKPLKEQHPQALFTLDLVSSVPYRKIDWQIWDAAYFSVQKGMGLPAGLGVLILGPRALERSNQLRESGHTTGSYHSFQSFLSKSVKNQTPETPNILNIYTLGKVCEDMLAKGLENIREETSLKARMLYDFFESQAQLKPFVKDARVRSQTVAVIEVEGGSTELLAHLEQSGFIVGNGYGPFKGKHIRVANFPAVSVADTERLIEAMRLH